MEVATKYYVVKCYVVDGPVQCTYKHHFDREEAVGEAKQLAEAHPGTKFFVLEAVECYAVVQPKAQQIPLKRNGER